MSIKRIVPNISSNKIEESKVFYQDFLCLTLAMDMDWILTFVSEAYPQVQISIVRSNERNVQNGTISITIEVENVDNIYKQAISYNYEITYPLTLEPWGVKRFFVKDPNGVTINVMCHQ